MKCGASLFVVMLAGLTSARAAEQPAATVIRGIQIIEEGGVTHVIIDANGPLPLPLSEPLNDPPRIFLDLAGVSPRVRATTLAPKGAVVSRVRVAQFSLNPQVTRVVLDLLRVESFRVDVDAHQSGRIRVLVGPDSAIHGGPAKGDVPSPSPPQPASAAPPTILPAPIAEVPAPPLRPGNATPAMAEGPGKPAPAPPPAVSAPAGTRSPVLSPEQPRPALPAMEVAVYRKQIYGELPRMESMRGLVARIDAGETLGLDTLALAEKEFTDLRHTLEAVKPSVVLAVTHDLLMTSCTFGAMASRLAIDAIQQNNADIRRRASSAAAGSMMIFDRACADLGCAKPPR